MQVRQRLRPSVRRGHPPKPSSSSGSFLMTVRSAGSTSSLSSSTAAVSEIFPVLSHRPRAGQSTQTTTRSARRRIA
jgi:hypothetical protein